ncbi:MAG: hypothetical protein KBT63_02090 [Porticoccaceae bacterium]|nr:hypothetical protein [Porticoccaceae bacterium]
MNAYSTDAGQQRVTDNEIKSETKNEMNKVKNTSWLKRNFPLLLIIATVTVVLVAGFVLLPRSEEGKIRLLEQLGTSNQGVLIKPLAVVTELALLDVEGKPWALDEQAVKWRLLIPVAAPCAEACREAIHLIRQVHVRLDKKSHRVERVLLNLDGALDDDTKTLLARDYRYVKVINGRRVEFEQVLAQTNAHWRPEQVQIFVVDQQGAAMMFYTAEHSGGQILADLRHLLKYSPE